MWRISGHDRLDGPIYEFEPSDNKYKITIYRDYHPDSDDGVIIVVDFKNDFIVTIGHPNNRGLFASAELAKQTAENFIKFIKEFV